MACLIVTLAAIWLPTSADRRPIQHTGSGEWAIDYHLRQRVLDYLISDLGLAPDDYGRKIWWWPWGWIASQPAYAWEASKRPSHNKQALALADEESVLVLSSTSVLTSAFNLRLLKDLPPLKIYAAKPKKSQGLARLSSNSPMPTLLNDFDDRLDKLLVNDGTYRLNEMGGAGNSEAYLIAFNNGRMKLLLRLVRHVGGRIFWRIDSPQLNGYYGELKTILRPRFALRDGRTNRRCSFLVVDGVFGSLLFKTPQQGEINCPGVDRPEVVFSVDGFFDQSTMEEPSLVAREWVLDDRATPTERLVARN
jgi:hypothetical protein